MPAARALGIIDQLTEVAAACFWPKAVGLADLALGKTPALSTAGSRNTIVC